MTDRFGTLPPRIETEPPGPESLRLARRLSVVESRNITQITDESPIFWAEASGANVRDADGNVYIDLTAGFGVAAAGHANPRVARAIAEQAGRLAHGLGDVYPAEVKVEVLERLAALAPGDLGVSILASAGTEAVEAALKTAVMHTGRPGILAFAGGYHGLTYGSLAATGRDEFREPFRAQLYSGVRFARYPRTGEADGALAEARERIEDAEGSEAPVGAVLVEPLQGRGGIIVPPDEFLEGLRALCDERGLVLIFDEVYSGFGRTGRWFASEHSGVVPDVMTVGKALTGAVPLSAAIGTPEVMASWPPSRGEAIHTSTFLGNPIACAAALAELDEIEERGLVGRAATVGTNLRDRLEQWCRRFDDVVEARGRGLMQGVRLAPGRGAEATPAHRTERIVHRALRRGVILLPEGPEADVLAFTPPLVITERQLGHALDIIEDELAAALGDGLPRPAGRD